jgi:hypothetical protein
VKCDASDDVLEPVALSTSLRFRLRLEFDEPVSAVDGFGGGNIAVDGGGHIEEEDLTGC